MIANITSLAVQWVVLTLAFLAAAAVVPGFEIKDVKSGFWVAAIFAVVGALLSKLLAVFFGVITLGIACLLPGVIAFLVNLTLIKIVDAITDLLEVKGLFPAALAAIILAVVPSLLGLVLS